jgi:hypothetical protein
MTRDRSVLARGAGAALVAGSVAVACGSGVTTYRLPPEPTAAPPAAPTAAPQRREFESPGGMWIPSQLGSSHAETLKKLGLEIDPAQLSDPMGYPLGAIISLGGCSASFVSPDGLVATNHHCITGALQYNSTPQQNLLENGYLAKTRADEKSIGPTGRVYVTQAFKDVTFDVRKDIEAVADDRKRHEEIEKRTKALLAACEKDRPTVRCEVAAYDGGAQYLLIERLQIKDVRLVYAPHEGVGNFGGEIDNWRWPRHGGDFSFYRAYVGKDGKPAEFSAENVPFKPRHHLKLATKPLSEGDLVFVAGYPGRTYRLATYDEVSEAVDWWYPRRVELCEDYLGLIGELSKADPEVKIKATPLDRGLSNTLTYTKGSLEGLTKGGAARTKERLEADLKAWIGSDASRQAKYGDVLPKLELIFDERKQTRDAEAALDEVVRFSSLLGSAVTIARLAEERAKPDAERKPDYQQRNWEMLEQGTRALEKRYSRTLDIALLERALMRASRLPEPQFRPLVEPFVGKGSFDRKALRQAIEKLYAGTQLERTEVRVKLLKTATLPQLRANRDPMMRAALALLPLVKTGEDRQDARNGALVLLRPRYIAALRDFIPTPIAPDANGTLRVTYGTVRGYRPRPEAPRHRPFTVVSQIPDKATGKEPFNAPERLLEAIRGKRFGAYVDPALGEVPVDFLADCDITGGNSGSATLNSRGEITGLVFDGNYEAMASDWLFMPEITRSIHVDIRYALWVMDAVDGADDLLREMGAEPSVQ